MSDPITKLQLLARAEMTLAQIHGRRVASRSALFSISIVFLLLGLAMLTVAVYQVLLPMLGSAWAAFSVAMVDTFLGIVLALVARRAGPSDNEEKLAREIRDMAYAEIGSDIEQVKSELEQITTDVKRIRTGVTAFTGGAINSVGPVLGMLLKAVKRS